MAATDTAAPPALNAHDFLDIDALLSDEERDDPRHRARVRARAARCRTSPSGSRRARCRASSRRSSASSACSACTSRATAAPAPARRPTASPALELEAGDSGPALASSPCRARWRCSRSGAGARRSRSSEWLPRMAAGEAIGCFGLTEPDAGSDPGVDAHPRAPRRRRLDPQRHEDVDHQRLDRRRRRRLGGDRRRASAASSSRPDTPGFTHAGHPHEAVAARVGHLRADPRRRARCPPTRCCPRRVGLRGPLSLPERGPLRDRLGRRRRRPRVLRVARSSTPASGSCSASRSPATS